MPYFSVVIPLFNKEKFIARTLQSVLAQTFTDFEVIVVDDHSTDNSLEESRKFESPNVKIVQHDHNKGLSASRNTGIKNASSDYIAFIDADDIWEPIFLEKMRELIAKFPQAGIYASAYREVYSGNVTLGIHKSGELDGEMQLIDDFFATDTKQPILWYGCAVVKKEVFEKVGGFDESITYGEDTDFNIRAGLRYKLAYCNEICSSYTIDSENQVTKTSFNKRILIDLDQYEPMAASNPSLKKYLDVNRYVFAVEYKLAGNDERFNKLVSRIDSGNLTKRQRFILNAPTFSVKILRQIKREFLKRGIRFTTFRK